jgi:hypothetical protein
MRKTLQDIMTSLKRFETEVLLALRHVESERSAVAAAADTDAMRLIVKVLAATGPVKLSREVLESETPGLLEMYHNPIDYSETVRLVPTSGARTGWVALAGQLVGNGMDGFHTVHNWDGRYYDTYAEAEKAGWQLAVDTDDFRNAHVSEGVLDWLGFDGQKFSPDSDHWEDYCDTAAEFGWAVDSVEAILASPVEVPRG